jgi:hypothetical protein
MTDELQTLILEFLPQTREVYLTAVTIEQASVRLQLTATAPTAGCPSCGVASSSIDSRY